MVMVMVIGGDDDDDGDIAEQRWDVLTTRGAMSRLYHQQSWSRVVDRETMTMTMNIDILPRCPASAGCSEVSSTICSPIHRTAQGQSQPLSNQYQSICTNTNINTKYKDIPPSVSKRPI